MQTLEDVIVDSAKFKPEIQQASRELARTKPWTGTIPKRLADFKAWVKVAETAYGLESISVVRAGRAMGCSGESEVSKDGRKIILKGRLSVVTLFHLFAKCRAIQSGHRPTDNGEAQAFHFDAQKWSINLFKRRFPISFGRCRLVNGMLVNDNRRD